MGFGVARDELGRLNVDGGDDGGETYESDDVEGCCTCGGDWARLAVYCVADRTEPVAEDIDDVLP